MIVPAGQAVKSAKLFAVRPQALMLHHEIVVTLYDVEQLEVR